MTEEHDWAELLKGSKVGPTPIDPVKRLMARRLVDEATGCWLWTGARDENGYGIINLRGTTYNRGRISKVHRFAAILWLNLPDDSRVVVRHTCDNPHCFNPEHLLLGSQRDNMQDAARKGTMAKKLSFDDVRTIRHLHSEGVSMNELGRRYNVSARAISMVVKRVTFVDVE
jgi:hypothetical protein